MVGNPFEDMFPGCGLVGAYDEDTATVVTINGAYLQGWAYDGREWRVYWIRSRHDDLYSMTAAKALDLCRDYLTEIMAGLPHDA